MDWKRMKLILCGFPIVGQRPQPGFAERFRRGYKYVHTKSASKFENDFSKVIFFFSTLKAANKGYWKLLHILWTINVIYMCSWCKCR